MVYSRFHKKSESSFLFLIKVGKLDNINKKMDDGLRDFFTWWGTGIARYPVLVLFIMVCVVVALTCGK